MNAALLSSKNMNWCTPQDFFDRLDAEFHFVLDAAATKKSAKCEKFFTPETDGLAQSWDCGGAVFCNPPYGRQICKWVQKAFKESAGGYPIVLLIPARTDTTYFHDYIYGKADPLHSRAVALHGRKRKRRRPSTVSINGGCL